MPGDDTVASNESDSSSPMPPRRRPLELSASDPSTGSGSPGKAPSASADLDAMASTKTRASDPTSVEPAPGFEMRTTPLPGATGRSKADRHQTRDWNVFGVKLPGIPTKQGLRGMDDATFDLAKFWREFSAIQKSAGSVPRDESGPVELSHEAEHLMRMHLRANRGKDPTDGDSGRPWKAVKEAEHAVWAGGRGAAGASMCEFDSEILRTRQDRWEELMVEQMRADPDRLEGPPLDKLHAQELRMIARLADTKAEEIEATFSGNHSEKKPGVSSRCFDSFDMIAQLTNKMADEVEATSSGDDDVQ